MSAPDRTINVAVTGDVNVDWNIKASNDPNLHNLWKADREKGLICYSFGSAVQLGRLVSESLALCGDCKHTVERVSEEDLELTCFDAWDHLINLFEKDKHEGWRQTMSMGRQVRRAPGPPAGYKRIPSGIHDTDVLVIDDKRFGYRDDETQWQDAFGKPTWIILRMARELCKGKLWETLSTHHAEKLIVVVTAKDLLDKDIHAERELSWEQAIDDILRGLSINKDLKGLLGIFSVVVLFDDAGALQIFGTASDGLVHRNLLCFEPKTFQFSAENRPGRVSGFAYTFIAALTTTLVLSLQAHQRQASTSPRNLMTLENWISALSHGAAAMKNLNERGFLENEKMHRIEFPFESIALTIRDGPCTHKLIELDSAPNALDWSILKHTVNDLSHTGAVLKGEPIADAAPLTITDLSMRVVENGFESVFPAVPYLKCGDLFSIDRQEIQSLRSLQQIMAHYLEPQDGARTSQRFVTRKPLCIAVFGEPGSGKSFAVKQLAAAIDPEKRLVGEPLTFNLSQFSNADALIDAWHQVRDQVIKGVTPLVFWDEFDSTIESRAFGWLRYFLAPMQDGVFQQGQITHPIGPAIFVFAGGVSSSMAIFRRNEDPKAFPDAKVADFISRLHGFLNIAGINAPASEQEFDHPSDLWMIRRAVIIRSSCMRYWKGNVFEGDSASAKMNISPTLLEALLRVAKYKHGARSLDTIINSCRLSRSTRFNSSALPPPPLLDIHVENLSEFRACLSPMRAVD